MPGERKNNPMLEGIAEIMYGKPHKAYDRLLTAAQHSTPFSYEDKGLLFLHIKRLSERGTPTAPITRAAYRNHFQGHSPVSTKDVFDLIISETRRGMDAQADVFLEENFHPLKRDYDFMPILPKLAREGIDATPFLERFIKKDPHLMYYSSRESDRTMLVETLIDMANEAEASPCGVRHMRKKASGLLTLMSETITPGHIPGTGSDGWSGGDENLSMARSVFLHHLPRLAISGLDVSGALAQSLKWEHEMLAGSELSVFKLEDALSPPDKSKRYDGFYRSFLRTQPATVPFLRDSYNGASTRVMGANLYMRVLGTFVPILGRLASAGVDVETAAKAVAHEIGDPKYFDAVMNVQRVAENTPGIRHE